MVRIVSVNATFESERNYNHPLHMFFTFPCSLILNQVNGHRLDFQFNKKGGNLHIKGGNLHIHLSWWSMRWCGVWEFDRS